MHFVTFYEDVPCQLCTSSIFMKMFLVNYAHLRFYEDVPCQLCISSLFMKMYLFNYAHLHFLLRCDSSTVHILAFHGDMPRQSCTSSSLRMFLTNRRVHKMAGNRRSDLYVVFTMILCGTYFCVG